MRWIVELCHNPLIQTFPFLIERFEFVTLAPHRAILPWLETKLVSTCSVPARRQPFSAVSQIRRKDQPILAPSQRNAEFLLIIRLGSDHLITGLPSFLECRSHFRYILTRTSDKNVIAMHRPRHGAQLFVEAATRHSANGETATDEPFFSTLLTTMLQLGEFRTMPCAASRHALSGMRQVHSLATQQRCLFFSSA